MLNMRAKPPPAEDFIDIFEKFKYAFNLLAKLKAHIHDPNAPELVHFLFTPLSLIYEASRDPVHGGRDLAESATKPAITQDARQLLLNCLTSKELELWQSLGKSWTNNRWGFEITLWYKHPYLFQTCILRRVYFFWMSFGFNHHQTSYIYYGYFKSGIISWWILLIFLIKMSFINCTEIGHDFLKYYFINTMRTVGHSFNSLHISVISRKQPFLIFGTKITSLVEDKLSNKFLETSKTFG